MSTKGARSPAQPKGLGQPLPLPHERDESSNDTAAAPDPVVVQAARDIEAGQVDTDLHGTPGMDHEQREALLEREKGANVKNGEKAIGAKRAAAPRGSRLG